MGELAIVIVACVPVVLFALAAFVADDGAAGYHKEYLDLNGALFHASDCWCEVRARETGETPGT